MAMHTREGDDDGLLAAINTTPLVDVMLVLLIIFLITVPVVVHTVPVHLPQEQIPPAAAPPRTITIAVDADGRIFWNDVALDGIPALRSRLAGATEPGPPPEVDIRGDRDAAFAAVGQVLAECGRAGIVKLGFITEPPAGTATGPAP